MIFWPLGDFGDNKENYELSEMLGVDETVEDREEVEVETVPVEVEVPVKDVSWKIFSVFLI